jgi:hypothetical protein
MGNRDILRQNRIIISFEQRHIYKYFLCKDIEIFVIKVWNECYVTRALWNTVGLIMIVTRKIAVYSQGKEIDSTMWPVLGGVKRSSKNSAGQRVAT